MKNSMNGSVQLAEKIPFAIRLAVGLSKIFHRGFEEQLKYYARGRVLDVGGWDYYLKPGGHDLFVIPQTANLHMAPAHFQNFTRYWIIETMNHANLEILELTPSGGVWRTLASRSALFFWHAFKAKGCYIKGVKRPLAFYVPFPVMAVYAAICLTLSRGSC